MDRSGIVALASIAYPSFPLTVRSSRATLIAWLEEYEPNGIHSDEACIAHGLEPHTRATAWETVGRLALGVSETYMYGEYVYT